MRILKYLLKWILTEALFLGKFQIFGLFHEELWYLINIFNRIFQEKYLRRYEESSKTVFKLTHLMTIGNFPACTLIPSAQLFESLTTQNLASILLSFLRTKTIFLGQCAQHILEDVWLTWDFSPSFLSCFAPKHQYNLILTLLFSLQIKN